MNKTKKVSTLKVVSIIMANKALLLMILIALALSIASPYFLTGTNLMNLLRQVCVSVIMGTGYTLLLSSGSMDLSVGNLMGLQGIIMAILAVNGQSPVVCIGVGLVVGIVGMCMNTFFVQQFQLPGFILTLATGMIFKGLIWIVSGGQSVSNIPEWFKFMGQGTILGIPFQVYVMIISMLFMAYLIKCTLFGRHALSMGGNPVAAKVCGINIKKDKYIIAMIMGVFVTMAAVITTGRSASAQLTAGQDSALDTIAAVVVGGTLMSGGVANVPGTLVGCLLIQLISNGLNLMDIDTNWHQVAKGVIIIIAVIMDIQGTKLLDGLRIKEAESTKVAEVE